MEQTKETTVFVAVRDRVGELTEELNNMEDAYDEKMITETEYYTNKTETKIRMDEDKVIIERLKRSGLSEEALDEDAPQMTEIGRNGTLRLYCTESMHILLHADGKCTMDLDNPTIKEVEQWKRLLGME